VRLTQHSEEGLETGAVELGPRRVRRVLRRRATRDKLVPPILEVLCEFLDDLALASGRQAQRRKERAGVRPPLILSNRRRVSHVCLS
jgi:hypothetical protein